jgi:hypothetical protein
MKAQGIGATEIAKKLGIGRASGGKLIGIGDHISAPQTGTLGTGQRPRTVDDLLVSTPQNPSGQGAALRSSARSVEPRSRLRGIMASNIVTTHAGA